MSLEAPNLANCTEKTFIQRLLKCPNGNATTGPSTINALFAAIAVSAGLLALQVLAFVLLRNRLSRIYRPKSYLVSKRERVSPPPGGAIGWLYPLWTTSNQTLIAKCGLDAYFFLRFLRTQLKIFFPAALIAIPILLPINVTGHGIQSGLSRYSLSNVSSSYGNRYWAHLLLALAFIAWFFYVVFHEFRSYIRIRQDYLTSPEHRMRASATTVLVACIPQRYLSVDALSHLYDVYPGGTRNIWINRHYGALADKVELRADVVESLEEAETNLIKMCHNKAAKNISPLASHGSGDGQVSVDQEADAHWRRYLEPKERETMRLPVFNPGWGFSIRLPFLGQKVDRIYHLRRELARLNSEIESDQSDVNKYPVMNSAFIQFNSQIAAHMCCECLSCPIPGQMAPRIVEMSPDDVIWDNLSITWWGRYLRSVIVVAVAASLVIFWAIPVAFSGLLSNLSELAQYAPDLNVFLKPKYNLIRAAIQGVLPALLLAVILLLVPIIFRLLVGIQGVATGNAKEQGVQRWYFAFLFIQVFFIVTISTGLVAFLTNFVTSFTPSQVFGLVADSLPPAANYFFSYLTVQALSYSASALIQPGSLITWFILGPLMDSTARQRWRRQTELNTIQWGSFFPPFTNFAAIGIIYSILSPLILVFMLLIFGLYWIVHRYNVLFVYQFKDDTGGLLFPVALNQLFTGLYFMEICLAGVFFSVDDNGVRRCIAQGAIMVVALLLTALLQWQMNATFEPLFRYLPISLEDEAVVRDKQFTRAQTSRLAPLLQQEDAQDGLYAGIPDELEEVSQEQREELIRGAFQHPAFTAKRPVVWIPSESLGVSDDEIQRASEILMSNQGAALVAGKVVVERCPPDFSSVDLIAL